MNSSLVINAVDAMGAAPVTVFHMRGKIDTMTYEQLQNKGDEAYRNGTRNLLLDLSEVDYVSSAGLRAIHHIFTTLREASPDESDEAISKGIRAGTYKSRHLKLLNPSRDVQVVLKAAGFDMYIEIFNNLKEAVASF